MCQMGQLAKTNTEREDLSGRSKHCTRIQTGHLLNQWSATMTTDSEEAYKDKTLVGQGSGFYMVFKLKLHS